MKSADAHLLSQNHLFKMIETFLTVLLTSLTVYSRLEESTKCTPHSPDHGFNNPFFSQLCWPGTPVCWWHVLYPETFRVVLSGTKLNNILGSGLEAEVSPCSWLLGQVFVPLPLPGISFVSPNTSVFWRNLSTKWKVFDNKSMGLKLFTKLNSVGPTCYLFPKTIS